MWAAVAAAAVVMASMDWSSSDKIEIKLYFQHIDIILWMKEQIARIEQSEQTMSVW